MKTIYIALACILIIGMGCHAHKEVSALQYGNGSFVVAARQCIDHPSADAIDSKVGVLDCGDISFYYDYGRYSNSGPLTIEEDFRQSFDTYHHTRFFEDRMIDPKVYKLFLDSVKVVDVRSKADEDLMFACEPCNAVAQVTFKGDTYFYPLTLSEKQLGDRGFEAEFFDREIFRHKIYQEGDGMPGLYITPIFNRFHKKDCLAMTVKETQLSPDEVTEILRSVFVVPAENRER